MGRRVENHDCFFFAVCCGCQQPLAALRSHVEDLERSETRVEQDEGGKSQQRRFLGG